MLNYHTKNQFKRWSLSEKIFCIRIKQSDLPWKFWGRRIFHYSQVEAVLLHQWKSEQISTHQSFNPSNFYILPMKALLPPVVIWNRTLKSKNWKRSWKFSTKKWIHFSRESRIPVVYIDFYRNIGAIHKVCTQ